MSGFRLPGHPSQAAPALAFRFNGRDYRGHQGDTLASALIANGVVLAGRSFKYHRPRGIVGIGYGETNALVQLGRGAASAPNMLATRVPLVAGLEARSVNCWPSVGFDVGAVNGLVAPLLSAGFYYKTFMWPRWETFEPLIRRAAGLGRAPIAPDPACYAARSHACEVLVVGGGVAGLAAARAAIASGASVTLVEAEPRLGGLTGDDEGEIEGVPARRWIERAGDEVRAAGGIVLTRTTATGFYDHNFVTAVQEVDGPQLRQRFWKIRAKRVVLAGGAFERPLLFAGNDRPGVMLADAVRQYLLRHGVAAGRRLVVAGSHDSAYRAALAAAGAGLAVAALVDLRERPGPLARDVEAAGVPVLAGGRILRAIGAKAVRAIEVAEAGGRRRRIDCDLIAMSGGWAPAVQLFSQSGGSLRFDADAGAFLPDRSPQDERSCGAARGVLDLAGCVADGAAAGRGDRSAPAAPSICAVAPSLPEGGGKAFVDFQTDVTVADLAQTTQENYRSVEHVKRYTVWGMGTDQGKLSAMNGIAVLAALQGVEPGALGTTKFRPPFAPLAFGALAADRPKGGLFHPWKRLPAHDWHVAKGAAFEDHGWLRPSHYPRGAETIADAAAREALAVRNAVGLLDSSSLGKIELKGPDAGRFLDLMSLGQPSRVAVGGIRYNLLLNELGTILDDGAVARLAEDHYLLTSSSGHAERVFRWLDEWHQCEWPLDLVLQDVTARWAVLNVAGPRARAVLERTGCDVDLSRAAFPRNRIRSGHIAGAPVRIQRVSFTGELSYEVAVAADLAESLADHLLACGAGEGIVPFGLEALDILRLEKGFVHIGSDTDSRTQPDDIGWGRNASRKAGDFIGKRSLLHASARAPGRAQLVGLRPIDPAVVVPAGAHVVGGDPHPSRGIVTSSAFSPTLGRSLALALVDGGRALIGRRVEVWSEGASWPAIVAAAAAYDPEGARVDG